MANPTLHNDPKQPGLLGPMEVYRLKKKQQGLATAQLMRCWTVFPKGNPLWRFLLARFFGGASGDVAS